MPPNPSKPCQEPTLPYAYPSEVMEDRSELIGVHDGSKGILVVKLRRVRNKSGKLMWVTGGDNYHDRSTSSCYY